MEGFDCNLLFVSRAADVVVQLLLAGTGKIADITAELLNKPRCGEGSCVRYSIGSIAHRLPPSLDSKPRSQFIIRVGKSAPLPIRASTCVEHVFTKCILVGAIDVGGRSWFFLTFFVPGEKFSTAVCIRAVLAFGAFNLTLYILADLKVNVGGNFRSLSYSNPFWGC